jgi:hypothetical protein
MVSFMVKAQRATTTAGVLKRRKPAQSGPINQRVGLNSDG